jgi:hypothetical protein
VPPAGLRWWFALVSLSSRTQVLAWFFLFIIAAGFAPARGDARLAVEVNVYWADVLVYEESWNSSDGQSASVWHRYKIGEIFEGETPGGAPLTFVNASYARTEAPTWAAEGSDVVEITAGGLRAEWYLENWDSLVLPSRRDPGNVGPYHAYYNSSYTGLDGTVTTSNTSNNGYGIVVVTQFPNDTIVTEHLVFNTFEIKMWANTTVVTPGPEGTEWTQHIWRLDGQHSRVSGSKQSLENPEHTPFSFGTGGYYAITFVVLAVIALTFFLRLFNRRS